MRSAARAFRAAATGLARHPDVATSPWIDRRNFEAGGRRAQLSRTVPLLPARRLPSLNDKRWSTKCRCGPGHPAEDGYEAVELARAARAGPEHRVRATGCAAHHDHPRGIRRHARGAPERVAGRGRVGTAAASRSARLLGLLDRKEAGREREAVRQRHLAELHEAQRRAQALDARANASRILAGGRRSKST